MDQTTTKHIRHAIHPSRYRIENGEPCVDIRLNGLEQFFDGRDPAPFRERDLDPDLALYLRDAGDDLFHEKHFRIIFWLGKPCEPGEIEEAFRAHFEYEHERIVRNGVQRRRTGQIALLLAIILLGGLLSLSQLIDSAMPGALGAAIKEGVEIAGWVVMWRPVEVLIYDWIPARHDRRVIDKLLEATLELRPGRGPIPSGATAPAGT